MKIDPCSSGSCRALNRREDHEPPRLACPVCGAPTVQPRAPGRSSRPSGLERLAYRGYPNPAREGG